MSIQLNDLSNRRGRLERGNHGSKQASFALVGVALVIVATVGAAASEGYFMHAKVTKISSDGAIDFWVTSVHRLPREESAPTGTDPSELPKVIATLEFKSTGSAPRVRDSGLVRSRISLRGKCEDIDRTTRVPVLQVRLKTSERWQQANLKPLNTAGFTGFKQIVAAVCSSEPEAGD